jgi:hypothetical protein
MGDVLTRYCRVDLARRRSPHHNVAVIGRSAPAPGFPAVHHRILTRFPLTESGGPLCDDLAQRIGYLRSLATFEPGPFEPGPFELGPGDHRSIQRATRCLNLAALIASDCGRPELARELCRRQFGCFPADHPFTADLTRLRFQPLINLARLRLRDGDGLGAHQLLDTLAGTFAARTTTILDDVEIDLRQATGTGQEHREVSRWLLDVLRTEGLRAVARAGRWDQALTLAQQHGTAPGRPEALQIEIIARCVNGDSTGALSVLTRTSPTGPWETAVAATLLALCRSATGGLRGSHLDALASSYAALPPAPQYVVSRVQLALAMIDLAAGSPVAGPIVDTAVALTRQTPDAYAAEALLTHPACFSRMTDADRRSLTQILDASGHGRRSIPAPLLDDLMHCVELSEQRLTALLGYGR